MIRNPQKKTFIFIQKQYQLSQTGTFSKLTELAARKVLLGLRYQNSKDVFIKSALYLYSLFFSEHYIWKMMPNFNDPRMNQVEKLSAQFSIDRSQFLGAGASGKVYKGYSSETDTLIAVKVVENKPHSERLKRQIKIMGEVKNLNHPNIVGYYGIVQQQHYVYFMLELCRGGTLKTLLQKSKISEPRAITLFKQILSGMTEINRMGKMHRDLKPDNILLDENEDIKISDFGLARDNEGMDKTAGAATPLYGAPEVYFRGYNYDAKCDVWSAGLILYEILTGEKVFDQDVIITIERLVIERDKFKNENKKLSLPPTLQKNWEYFINKMVKYDPKKRPTFEEIYKEFLDIEEDLRKRVFQKYDISPETQGSSSLAKKISPYLSSMKFSSVNRDRNLQEIMLEKFKQERSYDVLNNLNKWFIFIRQKNIMLTKLVELFNLSSYECMKNVRKYILLFLAGAAYTAKNIKLLQKLENGVLETIQGPINVEQIVSLHQEQFKEMIQVQKRKYSRSIEKYKVIMIKNEVLPKIFDKYMKRQEEANLILSMQNLFDLMIKFKEQKIEDQSVYLAEYKKICSKTGFYFTGPVLETFDEEYLVVYLHIRIIVKLDTFILNTEYKNEDYINSKLQMIKNANRQQLLKIIDELN